MHEAERHYRFHGMDHSSSSSSSSSNNNNDNSPYSYSVQEQEDTDHFIPTTTRNTLQLRKEGEYGKEEEEESHPEIVNVYNKKK